MEARRIYDITGTENISFESSSFSVKSNHTHKYKQVLPNNSIFKLGAKTTFCILQKVETSKNFQNIILVFCVLLHETGTILSTKRGIS
jgi:hypothetical protein